VGNLEEQKEEMIGTKLKLKCDKHGSVTKIQWPVDFTEVEEGGCKKPCGDVLSCGHKVRVFNNFFLSYININHLKKNSVP
jgi:hypothetical protein